MFELTLLFCFFLVLPLFSSLFLFPFSLPFFSLPFLSRYDDGPRTASGSSGSDPVYCTQADTNVVKGTMYVGVLAHLNDDALGSSSYTIELKIDKCTAYSCVSGNGNCEPSTGICVCNTYPAPSTDAMWQGTDCSSPVCPAPASGDAAGDACR